MIDLQIHYSWIKDRIAYHEGIKLTPYKCTAGKKTIGIGHNLEAEPLCKELIAMCPRYPNEITLDVAYILLRKDLNKVVDNLEKLPWVADLDIERQYALIDMCFQLGFKGLLKFKKMLKALQDGDFNRASIECINSAYHEQTPARCERIAALIRTGQWKV